MGNHQPTKNRVQIFQQFISIGKNGNQDEQFDERKGQNNYPKLELWEETKIKTKEK